LTDQKIPGPIFMQGKTFSHIFKEEIV